MKKIYFLFMALLSLGLASCDDEEKGSYPPIYQGFKYVPSTVYAGDSVTITAVQQQRGHYLYHADYNWKMTIQVDKNGEAQDTTLVCTQSLSANYDDPVWKLQLPSNTIAGVYTCNFRAEWKNSADGEGGIFEGTTGEGCTGTIRTESYTLYSTGNGNFKLPVRKKQ